MEGIDPEKENKDEDERNAYIYACENNYVDMLQMLIDNFQIRSDKGIDYRTFKYYTTKNNTGFIIACCLDNIDTIKLLLERYPDIIK